MYVCYIIHGQGEGEPGNEAGRALWGECEQAM